MIRCLTKILAFSIILGALLQPGLALSEETQPEESGYRVRPGDTLEISVAGESAYCGSFLVGAEGTILFSDEMVGSIAVAGLTLEETQARLTETLAQYLNDPAVSLQVSKFRVIVSGDVANPGSYEMSGGETLMDAITRAGGAKREISLARVELKRASGEQVSLAPQKFLQKADESQNPPLRPGDEILVGRSQLGQEFRVSGAVKFPGVYPLWKETPPSILQAVEAAGRWTPDADPRRTLLMTKNGTQLTIDLMALDANPADPSNLPLQPGDEIFVPRKALQITVQGAVNMPGPYLVEEGTTYLQAVGNAGGLKASAILNEAVLVRNKPNIEWIEVNLEKVLREGDMSANPVVHDGDVLWVAERDAPKQGSFDFLKNTLVPILWAFSL
ncbi:MAG: hypothetical protein GTO55_01355 [Armatimonadetes bacterium]|nr:hypothetical protein [Armatimonadota bacterium]NIM22923.1 hypothetical protein [Armatimonadota bacterium]NIM66795.1 hypothetical protein [Armatimonadota bacterium]NIM75337.1 hypothetical protein [Armatimonadota bacterium]NIN04983.1 hypothetical protein [Armatimonadota bacterium]